MIKEHFFRIADFIFSVKVPKTQDIVVLLPSLIPFRCEKTEAEPILFRFEAFSDELPCETEEKVIGESVNDLGFTRLKKCVKHSKKAFNKLPKHGAANYLKSL